MQVPAARILQARTSRGIKASAVEQGTLCRLHTTLWTSIQLYKEKEGMEGREGNGRESKSVIEGKAQECCFCCLVAPATAHGKRGKGS